ncbi:MAG: DUF3105 domain-containing protein [Patescibacteria group bacterium]|nr:DUF3105 domain-containing protein [Patescibacteria group bacterium]
MSNKSFVILIIVLCIGAAGFLTISKRAQPKEVMLGTKHTMQGQDHITRGQKHIAYNSQPASSGPHYNDQGAPAPWGAYGQEVPEEVFVHNEEHGGVIITYSPKLLSAENVDKLQKLFTSPYSMPKFSPSKALVTPRDKNTHAIQIASWLYTYNLDNYDATKLKQFYLQHVGNAPEARAGPSNTPTIN